MFYHLHTHSCFSFLEGLITPADLVQAATQSQMEALALTDHLWLTGAVSFYQACQQAGIQPILGLEIDLLLPYRLAVPPIAPLTGSLVLLAENQAGWENLCRLSSTILTQTHKVPTCDLQQIAQQAEGLICLTGGIRGAVARMQSPSGMLDQRDEDGLDLLESLHEIFPGRLYVEIQRHSAKENRTAARLIQAAEQLHLPTLATHSIYYLQARQARLQCTLSAIRCNTRLDQLSEDLAAPPGAYFKSSEDLEASFTDTPQALTAQREVIERCQFQLALGQAHTPQIPLPPGVSALELLREKAETGAHQLYGKMTPAIQQRLQHEISIIAERGYETVFLIAEEILNYARQADIPTASRGSASSSLVAHCLGITTPDPLVHDLYFERFLNPARTTPPDIDMDICSRRRDELLQHVFDTYGRDQTVLVGTVNTFRPRSALSDVAKAHGLHPAEIRAIANRLPYRFGPNPEAAPPGTGKNHPFAEIAALYPQHKVILNEGAALLGLPRHLSVHPGGVVITPGEVTRFLPVAQSESKGLAFSQFDLDAVEALGLIKLDLLGIRGLTVLGDVSARIRSWRRKEFRTSLDVLERIPEDEAETAALVSSGQTIGCFQIEIARHESRAQRD